MKKKVLAVLMACTMTVSLLAGCGSSQETNTTESSSTAATEQESASPESAEQASGEETQSSDEAIELTIMSGAQLTSVAEVVLKDYLAEHPNITINYEKYSYAEYPTKMRLQLSAGDSTPDIMIIHDLFARQFVDAGYLADVSDLITDGEVLDVMQPVKKDNQVYGLPNQVTNEYVFLYRTDIFDELGLEVPTTFDEYFETALKLKENGYYAGAFDPSNAGSYLMLYSFIYMLGGEVLDNDGNVSMAKSDEALALMKKCIDAGIWHNSLESDSEEYWTAWNAGKIACTPCVAAHASYYVSNVDPAGDGGYGSIAIADAFKLADDGRDTYINNTEYYCINANTQYMQACKDIVSYLALSEEAALKFSNVNEDGVMAQYCTGSMAGLQAVSQVTDGGWEAFGGQNVVAELSQKLLDAQPDIPYVDSRSSEIRTIMSDVLGEVFLNGTLDIKDATAEIIDRINQI